MNNKRAFKWICVFLKWIVRTWKFCREQRKEAELYKKFKRHCEIQLAKAKNKGVEIDKGHKPHIANGIYHIIGKYPNMAKFEYKCSFKAFKQVWCFYHDKY